MKNRVRKLIKKIVYPLIKSRPDFLIIGAEKCGTTSLYNYLCQHPQIMGHKSWKEIHYFDYPENYTQGLGWYLGNFPNKIRKGKKLTFEACPAYLYFPYIPELIKQDLGHIKMIAILRDPVERTYSAWKMYHSFLNNPKVGKFNQSIADPRTFSEAIEQELNNPYQPNAYPYDYVNRGKYVEQLENYYQYFNRDIILVLSINELQENFKYALNKICDFLSIKNFDQESLNRLKTQKYNVGLNLPKKSEDVEVMEALKDYFTPYNQKLYELLSWDRLW